MSESEHQEQKRPSGKSIALEGDAETIATQLRLLPSSQKILILPSRQEEQLPEEKESNFDARSYVREVHAAFTERTEVARSFLQNSTDAHPKLVFVNGGSVGARTRCIAKIAENLTGGEIGAAEDIFNDIVKDGVAGLMKVEANSEEDEKTLAEVEREEETEETPEDPSSRAMKAAESLDRETAALQSEDGPVEHGIPLKEHIDEKRDSVAEETTTPTSSRRQSQIPTFKGNVFKPHKADGIITPVLAIPNRHTSNQQGKRSAIGSLESVPLSAVSPRTVQTFQPVVVDDNQEQDNGSPVSPGFVIGEAQVIDVHSATREHFLRRAKSFDALHLSPETDECTIRSLKHTTSHNDLRQRPQVLEELKKSNCVGFPPLQRGPFLRASQTTIKKSLITRSFGSTGSTRRIFLERGTDAEEVISREPATEPFVPVFEMVEDFVIHFTGDVHNEVFESVIRSYKNGSYPIFPAQQALLPAPKEEHENLMSPQLMLSQSLDVKTRLQSHLTAESHDVDYKEERRGSFDPYAAHDYPAGIRRTAGPPTPLMTPPPTSNLSERFLTFSPVNPNNAICVQNSFRQLLTSHFPAEEGYSQYYYPMAPEADRLWKPVFRNEEGSSIGIDGRNVDQIIALGCEDGVGSELSSKISGLIEKLGMKRNGVNKSAKLDIRYLISNVMQAYSNPSGITHPTFNPLTNPHLLATLLIPHLEAYLAINSSTRLLILQYPSAHLPTIFALRKLLGHDTLKIAGILDSLASDPPSLSRPRTPISSGVNLLSNDAVASRNQSRLNCSHHRSDTGEIPIIVSPARGALVDSPSTTTSLHSPTKPSPIISFAKAEFLLPSTATDVEITTFLSSIWKTLMEKSAFYTPEPEPAPKIIEKYVDRPPVPAEAKTPEKSPRPRTPRERQHQQPPIALSQKREIKIARLTGSTIAHTRDPSTASTKKTYAASVSSMKTSASEKDRRDWENFYIGEEDSEDDEWDRMILGRAGVKMFIPEEEGRGSDDSEGKENASPGSRGGLRSRIATAERNTLSKRKALKWLGLA